MVRVLSRTAADLPHELQADLPHELQAGLPHELQAGLSHELQTGLPHELQAGLLHELQAGLPHELQAGLPHELQAGLPHELQAGLPHELQAGVGKPQTALISPRTAADLRGLRPADSIPPNSNAEYMLARAGWRAMTSRPRGKHKLEQTNKKTNKTKWQICRFFFIWPKKNVMHTFFFGVWWRYLIPFKSYSYLSKIDPASFKRFFVPLQTWVEISTFLYNYWYSFSREHFCSGLVPIGQKT